jgi:hypothetical protein
LRGFVIMAKRIFCNYCCKEINLDTFEYVEMRRVVKLTDAPPVWKSIGYCCLACDAEGNPTVTEYKE